MASMVLRKIASKLSEKWYTITVDETTELSNTEQMVLCLRYVDDDLKVHEKLIAIHICRHNLLNNSRPTAVLKSKN